MSLPMHPYLNDEQRDGIASALSSVVASDI